MTQEATSPSTRGARARQALYTAAACLLFGCQLVSGLNGLEADGKNVRDAGSQIDNEGASGREGDAAPADASEPATAPNVHEDAGKSAASDAGAAGAAAGSPAGSGGSHAAGAGAVGGRPASAGAAGMKPVSECTAPNNSGEKCDNTPQCGCKDSESCVFFPDAEGAYKLACRAAGTKPLYSACTEQNQDCQRGLQCLDGLCQAPCEDAAAQCPNAGSRCLQVFDARALPVMGLYTCTQTCNPANPAQTDDTFHSCGQGHICQVYELDTESYTGCVSGSRDPNGLSGRSCSHDEDCAEGNICSSAGRCQAYCRVGGNDCLAGQTCTPLAKKLLVKDVEFGTCGCPNPPSGAGSCDYGQHCGCRPGDQCAIAGDQKSACFAAGNIGYAGPCGATTDCQVGLTCLYGACHILCEGPPAASSCGAGTCQGFTLPGGLSSVYYVCRGGFAGTCTNLQLIGMSTLSADCRRVDGTNLTTTLDLDIKIRDTADGQLEFSPNQGGFASVCRDISITPNGQLGATCMTTDGQEVVSAPLELNNFITNLDGTLTFD